MFIEARWKTIAHREMVDQIIIHTMQVPCRAGAAEAVARRFHAGERKVSAHYCVDPETVVQCVHETDVAWHCPRANRRGIGIELAGYGVPAPASGRAATSWTSPEAAAMLQLAAELAAQVAARWEVPVARLSVQEIQHGARGFAGHVDVTNAFPGSGTHVDPGPDWPWEQYLELVRAARPSQG
jgi:N-acetyl-anhydromuramyl-L-alanine amidase AmpD